MCMTAIWYASMKCARACKILQQVVRDIPEGPIHDWKPQYQVRVPAGESYGRVEGPKGELGFYVVSNGKPNPWRYHVRAPSFINLTSLAECAVVDKVADVGRDAGSDRYCLGRSRPVTRRDRYEWIWDHQRSGGYP